MCILLNEKFRVAGTPSGVRTVPTKYEAAIVQTLKKDSPFIEALLGRAHLIHTFRNFNPKLGLSGRLAWLAQILHDLIEPSLLVQRPSTCRTIYNEWLSIDTETCLGVVDLPRADTLRTDNDSLRKGGSWRHQFQTS